MMGAGHSESSDPDDERLEELRAEADRHQGAARVPALMTYAQDLAMRYWRVGPGRPDGLRYLDRAIAVLAEVHGHLEPDDTITARTAVLWGWLLGTRHLGHGGPTEDRERGIDLLAEVVETGTAGRVEPALATTGRLVLGQLLLMRSLATLRSGGLTPQAVMTGGSTQDKANVDRAVGHFRAVAETPGQMPQMAEAARTMLGLAEMMQMLTGGLGGGFGGGFDFGGLSSALAKLQELQAAAATPGRTSFPNPFQFGGDVIAQMDPLDRPVVVVEGAAAPPAPGAPAAAPAAVRVPAAELRGAVLDLASLSDLVDGRVAATTIDRLLARADRLVDASDATDADRLLHAAALHRRGVLEGDGWGDEDRPAESDLRAAAAALELVDVPSLRASEADDALTLAVELVRYGHPVLETLAGQFREVGAALEQAGVDGLLYGQRGGWLLFADGRFRSTEPSRLPGHVVVVGDHMSTAAEARISMVSTAAQTVELVRRVRARPTQAAVFVSNPRGERRQATMDAMFLRRAFYPGSVGYGDTVENVSGCGDAEEVRRHLGASMLHLGCGVTAAGGVELAGGSVLEPVDIAVSTGRGGVAVLPPDRQGRGALVEALLTAGFRDVISFGASTPDALASLVYAVLHAEMVEQGSEAPVAVHRVRQWLRDPGRILPDHLPTWYHTLAGDRDLPVEAVAEVLTHHGL